jgi:hypothetical protein
MMLDDEEHRIGDPDCDGGWCDKGRGRWCYPRPCKCGGLIHAGPGDYDNGGNFYLQKKCDQCGYDFEEAD